MGDLNTTQRFTFLKLQNLLHILVNFGNFLFFDGRLWSGLSNGLWRCCICLASAIDAHTHSNGSHCVCQLIYRFVIESRIWRETRRIPRSTIGFFLNPPFLSPWQVYWKPHLRRNRRLCCVANSSLEALHFAPVLDFVRVYFAPFFPNPRPPFRLHPPHVLRTSSKFQRCLKTFILLHFDIRPLSFARALLLFDLWEVWYDDDILFYGNLISSVVYFFSSFIERFISGRQLMSRRFDEFLWGISQGVGIWTNWKITIIEKLRKFDQFLQWAWVKE